jgi:hypothetical protein
VRPYGTSSPVAAARAVDLYIGRAVIPRRR